MSDYRAHADADGYAPVLLNVDETARMLRISRRAVFVLIAAGDLRSITIGRRRRIPRAAVDDYVSGRLALAESGD